MAALILEFPTTSPNGFEFVKVLRYYFLSKEEICVAFSKLRTAKWNKQG